VADEALTPEQFAEQIRQLKVADILLSTVSTLGQLAYVKLDAKQLDDARLAIDAIAALLPLLQAHADEPTLRDFNQLLANVRIAYASGTDVSRIQDDGDVYKGEDAAPKGDAAAAAPKADEPGLDVSTIQDDGHVQDGDDKPVPDTPSEPIQ
jgi:hypothetical protein